MRLLAALALASCIALAWAQCTPSTVYDGGPVWGYWGWDSTTTTANTANPFQSKPSVCWTASQYNGVRRLPPTSGGNLRS